MRTFIDFGELAIFFFCAFMFGEVAGASFVMPADPSLCEVDPLGVTVAGTSLVIVLKVASDPGA